MIPTPNFSHLLPPSWSDIIPTWLSEDIPSFDYTGVIVGHTLETATLWCKQSGVLAGCPFVDHIFTYLNCTIQWHVHEGTYIDVSSTSSHNNKIAIAIITGTARELLLGERTALNLLARCSGIATRARNVVQLKQLHGFNGSIAGTRKTTPGFRLVEKYGLLVGGVDQHRMDLSSMIMLKDNHIWSTGSITRAVQLARQVGGFTLKIEVECRSETDAIEAITAGADIVMLDNFSPNQLSVTSKSLKQQFPRIIIEGSGGITPDNIIHYFSSDVDILSMGSLTQGVPHIDFSLKINSKN